MRYLKSLDSNSESEQEQENVSRVPAVFYSLSLQKQVDQLRENVNDICENMRLLSSVVDRLIDIVEPNLKQQQEQIQNAISNKGKDNGNDNKYLHYV
jgi:hypothetical protein